MPLGASPAEVEHARAFLRKWSLGRYLASYKAPAHATDKDVLVLSAHNTIRDAMAMLARRGVLSAPVLDEKRAVFLGFCSIGDIVAAFLRSNNSVELLLVRHQIGPEPGAPGDAAAHVPATPAERAGGGDGGVQQPIQFAELKARRRRIACCSCSILLTNKACICARWRR
jgi:CBS domain-containing protein